MRFLKMAITVAMALTACGTAHAETQPPCPNDGYIPAMMVPNKQVAESIYRSVGGALVPWNFKKFPIVEVEDKGDHWSVSQTDGKPSVTVTTPKPGTEMVTVTTGGGQLNMDINKCTGAISHAALAR